jgi:hypothetical protein
MGRHLERLCNRLQSAAPILSFEDQRIMSDQIYLTLQSDRRSEALQDLTRDLVRDLRSVDDLDAVTVTRSPQPGEKPVDVALLGQIVLTFLSGGAATALIGCLKGYIDRDRSLRVRFKSKDGTELELEGRHFEAASVDETINALRRLARP